MPSMTDREVQIKTALLSTLNELTDFLIVSVQDRTSAHDVEQGLWQRMLALGHEALKQFFIGCGTGDVGESIVQADGSRLKRFDALRDRTYLTVFGEFSLPRTVYGRREGQKIERVPLDARLQLPERKFSPLLQDWNQSMATELPFGKVNACLTRILGFEQSVNSLEQSNRGLSGSAAAFWKALPVPTATEEGELLVMTADGKGVVMRPSEQDEQAVAAAHKQGRPGNKKMALIGSVYSVDPYPRLPEQILSSLFRDASDPSSLPKSKRPPPKHKRVRGALLRNAQGKTDPQSDEIFGWMADEVRQRGLPGKKTLVMIMDGQESLWSSGLKQLPEEQFVITEILDLIHATSYIWSASHVFHRKGSPEAIAFAKQQIRCLLNNGVNEVITTLRRKSQQSDLASTANETLETVCGYFVNHAHRMRYKDYLDQGLPVASGVIEGACRNLVKDRMEQSGMRWTMKGAHAMLGLRSIQLSDLWEDFMQVWREGESQRLYPVAEDCANDGLYDQVRFA